MSMSLDFRPECISYSLCYSDQSQSGAYPVWSLLDPGNEFLDV